MISGIKVNDVILAVNDIDVTEMTNEKFEEVLKSSLETGQIEVKVKNNSNEDDEKMSVNSKEFNAGYYQNSLKNFKPKFKKCMIKTSQRYGFGLFTNPDIKPKHMVFRLEIDSPAYKANLRELDVIVEINKVNVRRKTINEVIRILNLSTKDDQVEILVIDNQGFDYYKDRKISLDKKVASPENTETFTNITKTDSQKSSVQRSETITQVEFEESMNQNEIIELSLTRNPSVSFGIGLKLLTSDPSLSKSRKPTEYISVIDVLPGSDAERGGILIDDVILKINKKSPQSIGEIGEILMTCPTINLFVSRKI